MATSDVTVPDIGDYQGVPVIEVLVKDGDTVAADQPLVVLESDKATMEVPSPGAGVVRGLKVKVGDKLSKGDRICRLEAEGGGDGDADKGKDKDKKKADDTDASAKSGGAKGKPAPDLFSEKDKGDEPAANEDEKPKKDAAAKSDDAGSKSAPANKDAKEKAPAKARSGGGRTAVVVPDIGNFTGVPVIEVLVKDGDTVAKDQSLITLESDKSTMDVPSPAAGVVRGLKLKVDDKVSKGDPICELEGEGGDEDAGGQTADAEAGDEKPKEDAESKSEKSDEPAKADVPKADAPKASKSADDPVAAKASATTDDAKAAEYAKDKDPVAHAGPATRKFARELGVNLARVKGSGPKGRVLVEDVQAFVKQQMTAPPTLPTAGAGAGGGGIPAVPPQDFSVYGEIELKPLARIRKLSATFLHRSWLNVPHVTQHDDADITELEAFRKSASEDTGVKLTLLPFVMKALSVAMKQYPEFNSSLAPDGASLILKKYCHLGFAADTPNGLVVPVVRDVWGKGIATLANECGELAKKARDGKLKPDEMKGGCLSISSLGGIGGSYFTPIVNAPEVAILGVSRGVMKPVWDGQAFQPRLMLPLSLSYDHRVIDGAYAARFIVALGKLLGDIRRLSL